MDMVSEHSGHFTSWAGTRLFYRVVEPEGPAAGTFVYVHGYAEHSGRYTSLTDPLIEAGWACRGFDNRGHGRSEGLRGYILRFRHQVYDIDAFISHAREDGARTPLVLFGHSAGAVAAIRYAADHQDEIDGLILSSMYLKNGEPVSPFELIGARLLDRVIPTLPVKSHAVHLLSRDPEVIADFRSDKLNYRDNVRVRTGLELISNYRPVLAVATRITIPVLMLHGTGDRIADPSTTPEVFELLRSERKRMRLYEGLYHELIHEPEAGEVVSDILAWLSELARRPG